MSWNSPSANSYVGGNAEINFSDSDNDSSGDYDIYFQASGDSSWSSATPSSTADEGSFTTFDWDTTNLNGDYTLNITDSSNYSNSITRDLKVDNNKPSVDSKSPTGFISDNSPTVSLSGKDSGSGIANVTFTVDGSRATDTSSASTDLSDLSQGKYTVNYNLTDNVGNKVKDKSWSFTVDTEYDGDTSPEFNPSSGNIFLMDNEDEDQTFKVELDGADSESDTEVKCLDGSGNEFDSVGPKSVSDDGTSFECELSADDYSGEKVEVHTEVCDEAGNCQELDDETATYYMDLDAPEITSLQTSSGASAFNSNFSIDLTVTDDASGVEKAEYYFDSDTSEGDGNEINYSDGQESYNVEISDLDSGSNTLYVRAKDKGGRWSEAEELEFDFYPNKDPEISVGHPKAVTVTAGDSTEFDLKIRNTGEFFLPSIELNVTNQIVSQTVSIQGLKKQESINKTVEISTAEEDIGSHEVKITSTSPDFESPFELIVEANKKQKQQIDSKFSEYSEKLDRLESNVSELKNNGLSDDRAERLDANLSGFKQKIQKAEKAINQREYYKANSALKDIETDYSKASSSYENIEKEHKKAQQKKLMFAGIAVALLLILGVIGYLVCSDEFDLNLDRLVDSDIKIEGLGDIENRIRAIFTSEDEAEEFEWNGFEN